MKNRMKKPTLPPVPKPGEMLSLESIRKTPQMPGGVRFLKAQRHKLQTMRDEIQQSFNAQLAQIDEVIMRVDLVVDGGINA
ncbi:hypothetical protein DGM98_14100 [Xanthomonas citri]|nr:hypothetical protein DGM98_14100 [Xanthomonas citri]